MRFVIGIVLALSVGIGAYLGSAQVADSAKTPPRKVTLRIGDVAALGQIQCRAIPWTRGSTRTRYAYLQCTKGPASRAPVTVDVGMAGGLYVFKKVGQTQCAWTGPFETVHPIFAASLRCTRGTSGANVSVKVRPDGIAILNPWGKMVYRKAWYR